MVYNFNKFHIDVHSLNYLLILNFASHFFLLYVLFYNKKIILKYIVKSILTSLYVVLGCFFIIALAGTAKNYNPDLKIVGFAAETENMIDNARKKLSSKNLNLIVANDVSDSSIGFDSNNNEVTLITEKEELKILKTSKEKVARKIVQFISKNILND